MKALFRIGVALGLTFLFSCGKDEEETYPDPMYGTLEATIDGQPQTTSTSLHSRTSRFHGYFETSFTASVYDNANRYYNINLIFNKSTFLAPGTYSLPSDSLDGSVGFSESNGTFKYWRTRKKAPMTLTITEVIREPDANGKPNQPYTRISGSFSFMADSIPQGNTATGSKTVTGTFKNVSLTIVKEFPNFQATINQQPFVGDISLSYGSGLQGYGLDLYLKAFNKFGDFIDIKLPFSNTTKITQGTFTIPFASYLKRLPNGNSNYWELPNNTDPNYKIIIDKVERSNTGNKMSGKIIFTASPAPFNQGTTGNAEIIATFTDIGFN